MQLFSVRGAFPGLRSLGRLHCGGSEAWVCPRLAANTVKLGTHWNLEPVMCLEKADTDETQKE